MSLHPMYLRRSPPASHSLLLGESSLRFREQGIHRNFLILRRDQPHPHPKRLEFGRIFANSLLNSLPAGNCGRRKGKRRPHRGLLASCRSIA
jgi:hypothetical protein